MSKDGIKLELIQMKYKDKALLTDTLRLWLPFAAAILAVGVVGALMTTIEHLSDSDNTKRYDGCLRAIQVKPVNEEGKRLACHLNGNQFVVEGK